MIRLVFALVAGFFCQDIQGQIFVNNGAQVTVREGAQVGILGSLLNDDGNFDNGGYVWIDGNLENNDVMSGDDGTSAIASSAYILRGDWINNSVYDPAIGRVELDTSIEQRITGTTPTVFHNLYLMGSLPLNVKRQTIDAFIDPTGTLRVLDAELATDNARMFVTNRATTAVTHGNGFVSSLGDAYISWETNSTGVYEFPVGSSLGVQRKRVVQLTPGSAAVNAMGVRFANVNATTEGYDIDMREQEICEINRLFYHRIYQISGADNMDVGIQYVAAQDGNWDFLVNWENSPAREWSTTDGSSAVGTFLRVNDWTAFADTSFAFGRQLQALLTANPTSICLGESTDLTVSGVNGPATISWLSPIDPSLPSGAVNLPLTFSVSPDQTTEYIVEVTANECTVSDTVVVVVEDPSQLAISIGPDPAITCDNSPLLFTADSSGGGATGVISWEVNGVVQAGQNGVTFLYSNPVNGAIVTAEYTTLAGCSGSASSNPVMVSTGDGVGVSISGQGPICVPEGEVIPLFASLSAPNTADLSITWFSEAELSCINGCNTTYVTPVTGDTSWVFITVTDLNSGCTATDSIQVCAIDLPGLFIPTAFTPDGDSDNDELFILGDIPEFQLNDFRVYNRWGELVFSTDNFNSGWDGTYKATPQEMDVYVYYVNATFIETGERTEMKGSVLLMR